MALSRRSFLGGALATGAFVGCRAFRAPSGLFAGGAPNLVLGVISDIHVDTGKGDFKKFGDTEQFEKTLRWFDAEGADGVVIAGDLADNGMVNQLECVGEAWFRVFPAGRSRTDGRKVEQLFVYGNHDLEGQRYDQFGFRYFEKTSFEAAQICRDPAKAWKLAFREDYAPIWTKEVKGYRFVGAHWKDGKDAWDGIPEVEPWFKGHADLIDRTKPFFFIQHPHPRGTVYGADAWGADKGYATRALSAFPNAIAFTGHSHESLTDERSIWQGAFTSVGTASLRYGGSVDQYEQRQGMLVKVYDDRIVFIRRDFLHDASLGDDWVVPLPLGGAKPFAFETRKAEGAAPRFPDGAAPVVWPYEDAEKKSWGWKVKIPCATAGATRAFRYEVRAVFTDADGRRVELVEKPFDAKYNMPRSMSGAPTECVVRSDRVPGALAPEITVVPLDCWGNRGKPITA